MYDKVVQDVKEEMQADFEEGLYKWKYNKISWNKVWIRVFVLWTVLILQLDS